MFLVVILHLLGHGGILENTSGIEHKSVFFLEVFAVCAVDLYALISGYVGYKDIPKKFKASKVITIWAQVFFYSFGIALLFFLFKDGSISLKGLIRSLFPVASCQYWYFSSYFALLLLMPLLNHVIRCLSRKQMTDSVILLIAVFSIYQFCCSCIGDFDPFSTCYGYSSIWLIILYFIGAWIKRIKLSYKLSISKWWALLFLSVLLSYFLEPIRGAFVSYTSPTILLIAISYVAIFERLKAGKVLKKIISFFAPAAFGVYLIHDNGLVREAFVSRLENVLPLDSAVYLICGVLLIAFLILVFGMLADKVRMWMFKVLRIDLGITVLGKVIDKKIEDIRGKVEEEDNE